MASDSDSDSDSDGLGGVLRQLSCRLCRRYFRDPVITGCGHSFCRVCISRYWKRCRGSFRCPKCRVPFPEIRLRPNRQLRNAVERAERLAARPWARRKRQRGPVEELLIERSPEGEPGRKRRRSGFPLTEAAPSMCPEHGEPLELFCSQDQRPVCVICRDLPQHWGHDFLPLRNGIQQYQTQDKRPKVVAEFQQQHHHFQEEQERLLLAQQQKPDDELVKHQTKNDRKLSVQISYLSKRHGELEGKCEKPASELLQDIRSTLSRCEEGRAQQPEEMVPELEERIRDFSQQTTALSESEGVHRHSAGCTGGTKWGPLRAHRSANVILDPDMAHPRLVLLEDGKRVRWTHTAATARQPRLNTPERFDIRLCVSLDLYQAFINLNYPPGEIKQIERARRIPRNHLLQDRPKKTNNRTPLVITYSPQLKPVQHIINKLQPILEQDTKLQEALGDRPIVSYRQPPNLKMILTNNHSTYHTNTNPGTFPCNKPHCQFCPHILSAYIIIGPNQVSYKIKNTYSCASRNIIYVIMYRKCPSAM
ncbi:zinc finger protein RFP-like [Pelodiscus sinensis]|uniref:zinc finger protein RFP-like n=1 Tax=Pelodiscus sinensis TaxID=13735 RepID=UPI003F6B1D64